jgi:peptide/nickel transport system substrate-binding protein
MRRVRKAAVAVLCAALATSLSACVQSERTQSGGGDGQTLVFAAAGAPKNFDPIWNDEGETFRVVRQMYDTLITHAPGTAELAPALAESWTTSPDGKAITFKLRQGVTFHDGTPFDAAAVCFNLDRWFHMKGAAAQSQMIYYGDVFEGFAHNESTAVGAPVYRSCQAPDPSTAVMRLNKAKGAFPAAMTLPSFSISSPTALKKYDADKVTQSGDSFSFNQYADAHPTGTGPYRFVRFDRGAGTVELTRNDDYWGPKAKIKRLIFKVIPDENARKQELRAGTIDGYDLPSPSDYASLKKDGFKLEVRPAFNILYLGINEKNTPALRDLRVRQALAYAINRDELVRTRLPEGATVATQFMPDTVAGYAKDLKPYPYDPAKAKALLAAAGAQHLTLKFYYPTEVTRPYMPNPKDLFTVIARDLTAVGITIQPVARPWNGGYKDDVQTSGKQDLHLLGWTGDYNDAGNFVGTFFGRSKPEFGFDDASLFREIAAADAEPDAAKRAQMYEQVNRDIMNKYLPAVPISHSPPAIVVRSNVNGLIPSPLTDERFATVTKG